MTRGELNLLWSKQLFRHLAEHGLSFAVMAPGARNLPLLEALRLERAIESVPCIDERGAAYQALGWLKGRRALGFDRELAAVVCTSGSALLNLAPALAEAAASGLPLLAISADRPVEDQECGSNQTLDAKALPANLLRARRLLPLPEEDLLKRIPVWCRDSCEVALLNKGPVHLNQPFREVLLGPLDESSNDQLPELRGVAPMMQVANEVTPAGLEGSLSSCRRGLIWACGLDHPRDREAARAWARELGWPLLTDAVSGCLGSKDKAILRHGEQLLEQLALCDGVIQLGRRPVSRPLLAALGSRVRLQIDDHPGLQDPAFSGALRLRIPVRASAHLAVLVGLGQVQESSWTRKLIEQDQRAEALIGSRLTKHEWCEVGICRAMLAGLPNECGLLLGNSLPIRLADQYAPAESARLRIAANRGLSGIDGLLATACGFQRGLATPAALLIGDLSLAHDLSSLALMREVPLLVVVQNNEGGAIFDIHPASRQRRWARFGTGMRFSGVARALEIEAHCVDTLPEFRKALAAWVSRPEPLLIECMLPAGGHATWQKSLQKAES